LLSFLFFLLLHVFHLLSVGGRNEGLLVGELVSFGLAFLLDLPLLSALFLAVPNLSLLQKVLDVTRFLFLKK
jgi:hypothetical protein